MSFCRYYHEGTCWGQKNSPKVDCNGDITNCEDQDYKIKINEQNKIDIQVAAAQDLSGAQAVCMINAIQYLLNWKETRNSDDLKKAIWYIKNLERIKNK